MKKAATLLVGVALVLGLASWAAAATETWTNVSVVDKMCKDKVKADPDKHPVKCAMSCGGSGFGILTSDGNFLQFDKAGNEKALAALKTTKKTDHLRATVTGERNGDTIKVTSFSLE